MVEAAFAELGSGTVVSHLSAAVIHGLPVPSRLLGQVWVTRRTPGHGDHRVRLRSSESNLEDDDIVEVDGIRVTSAERTAADVARVVPYEWAVAIMDAYLRAAADPDARPAMFARIDSEARRRGNVRARAATGFADPLAESPGESISRVIFASQGLPKPVLQYEVWDSGRLVGRSDFAWEECRTLGEFDGAVKYAGVLDGATDPASVIMEEKRREQHFRDSGFWVTRWEWRELQDPASLARQIRRAFGWGSRP